jgi:hypothetical protein
MVERRPSRRAGESRKTRAAMADTQRPRPALRLVRTAFRAALLPLAELRPRALLCACRERASCEAALLQDRLRAVVVARDLVFDGGCPAAPPAAESRSAFLRVSAEAFPLGAGNRTPARLAFDSPIAMACFAERAPCFPSRICSISSCTNSPACVEGALPSRSSFRAFSIVLFSGISETSVGAQAIMFP